MEHLEVGIKYVSSLSTTALFHVDIEMLSASD